MADIVIRGMEMPRSGCVVVNIHPDGTVYVNGVYPTKLLSAVPLPEGHGRLVDAREVSEKADKAPWFDGDVSELGLLLESEVTTIVPAEEGEADGNP